MNTSSSTQPRICILHQQLRISKIILAKTRRPEKFAPLLFSKLRSRKCLKPTYHSTFPASDRHRLKHSSICKRWTSPQERNLTTCKVEWCMARVGRLRQWEMHDRGIHFTFLIPNVGQEPGHAVRERILPSKGQHLWKMQRTMSQASDVISIVCGMSSERTPWVLDSKLSHIFRHFPM